jgi:hypothetical protein
MDPPGFETRGLLEQRACHSTKCAPFGPGRPFRRRLAATGARALPRRRAGLHADRAAGGARPARAAPGTAAARHGACSRLRHGDRALAAAPSFGAAAYHEFYRDDFEPRAHYRPLWEHIRKAGQALISDKVREAHLALNTEGVTFTVYTHTLRYAV